MPMEAQGRSPRGADLRSSLNRAMRNGELFLAYQPIVSARSLKVEAVEALARWRHPILGVLEAHEFIGKAEQAGCLPDIDRWAAEQAIAQAGEWERSGHALTVHFNASVKSVEDQQYAGRIERWLVEHDTAPSLVVLELTERTVADAEERVIHTLQAVRGLGCEIAMDDFGSGQSSLSRMSRLPVTHLKLDQGFLRDTEGPSPTIVRGVVRLAHELGLTVTAEGVESVAQLVLVQEARANAVQGHLVSRPVSAHDAGQLARQSAVDGGLANRIHGTHAQPGRANATRTNVA